MALAVPAVAQTTATGTPSGYSDIIVTAQRRAERLSDVGITIVAATGEQLQSAGVTEVVDLPKIAPGLTTGTTYAGFPVFSMRGVNFNAAQIATPPAVSVYVDEAALPYAPMTAGMMFDLERVEILKGPQGTLYGQNATGGSINLIAAKPTERLSAGFSGEVNHFGQVMVEGFVSGPLSDSLRARVAATTTQGGAWQRGYYLGTREIGDQNRASGRLLLDWTPGERVKFALHIGANYDHGESQQAQLHLVAPIIPAAAAPGLIGYPLPRGNRDADVDSDYDFHQRNRQFNAALRADFELNDHMTLTSLTSYVNTKVYQPRDYDGTVLVLARGTTGGTIETIFQEVRLSGEMPDAGVRYIVGANYQYDDIFDHVTAEYGFSSLPAGTRPDWKFDLSNRAAGVFGNVDVDLSRNVALTAGIRYTDSRQTVDGCLEGNVLMAAVQGTIAGMSRPGVENAYFSARCLVVNDIGPNADYLPTTTAHAQNEDNLSWRLGINIKPDDDTLVYGLVSRGYKSGTYPLTGVLLASQVRDLKQEELTSYELGGKFSLFDRKLQMNLSIFYYDYKDKQFYTYVPVPAIGSVSTLINIPRSEDYGFDAEIVVRPFEGLTLRGGVTYVQTEVRAYRGFNSLGQVVDFGRREFNFAPPWSGTFDAEYRAPLSSGLSGYLGIGGTFSSRTFADLGESAVTRIPARAVLDARIGVEAGAGWRIGLFARNFTDEDYWQSVAYSADNLDRFAGLPRTFGVTAGYRF
ncbi:hypothetical protein A0J57_03960 [Sphingobium sp. 22B]|nr:hypothetical protein AXW74_00510 [Sphingobium sp. AM]KYC33749.1 hypothetical protein A0J57_03960 [Sphingobium sp. 22B]OAP33487.1 hypothetical protein A8O16_03180 [Sphingobium sp. 20006FA]